MDGGRRKVEGGRWRKHGGLSRVRLLLALRAGAVGACTVQQGCAEGVQRACKGACKGRQVRPLPPAGLADSCHPVRCEGLPLAPALAMLDQVARQAKVGEPHGALLGDGGAWIWLGTGRG